MSRIKSKNTKPELLVRKVLFSNGFRYKLHDKKLPGKPDIVLPKYKTVFFVHGCFWHGHKGCKFYVIPKTRRDWWINKFETNIRNDKLNIRKLKHLGWKVMVIWECDLKSNKREQAMRLIIRKLQNSA